MPRKKPIQTQDEPATQSIAVNEAESASPTTLATAQPAVTQKKKASSKVVKEPKQEPVPKKASPKRIRKTKAGVDHPVDDLASEAPIASQPTSASVHEDDAELLSLTQWREREEKLDIVFRPREANTRQSSADDDQPLAPKRSRNRNRRGRDEAPASVPEPTPQPRRDMSDIETGFDSDDWDVPIVFRLAKTSDRPTRQPQEPNRPQHSRDNQRQKHETSERVIAVDPEPEVASEPVKPVRRRISVPEEAPQVLLRNGIPTLVIDKKAYAPIVFSGGGTDENSIRTSIEEVKLAADAGVHIHALPIKLEVSSTGVDAATYAAKTLVKRLADADPQALVILKVEFAAPKGWEITYPDSVCEYTRHRDLPSLCDEDFWAAAKDCLENWITAIFDDTKARLIGIHLGAEPWFNESRDLFDHSMAAKRKFRLWAKARYSSDTVNLRTAWFNGNVTFDSIEIPIASAGDSDATFMRSSRKQRKFVDFNLFLSDATMERISDLSYAIKHASDGRLLVGVNYGSTFDASYPQSGQLALGQLLRTQELDFISAPPSYSNRTPGSTAPFPCPIDSISLNGKLFIFEQDYKTALGRAHRYEDENPMLREPSALDSVHWRDLGASLCHGAGVEWSDALGDGWLNTPSIWSRAGSFRDALYMRMGAENTNPDVIVFIDERALAYLVDENAFLLLVQNVRESVMRSGLSVGYYLLSDLAHREKFPDARLYIFLNAWDIRPALRTAIKTRLQKDGKVLFWLYGAGMFDGGRYSLERAREVTGIAIKPQPFASKSGTSIKQKRHPLCDALPDRGVIGGTKFEPSYFAIPENALVLGEYTHTSLPSFVVREFKESSDPAEHWTSVFLGEPIVSPGLIRSLGQMANAHVYNHQDDVVHARPPFLTVHCQAQGARTLTLPSRWAAYSLQSDQYVVTDANTVKFNAAAGSTQSFLIQEKEELDALLSIKMNPKTVTRVDHLPPRELNTIDETRTAFDIPILSLGDWMEGSSGEDVIEDWLLRPKLEEFEAISGESNDARPASDRERPARRRRRRERGTFAGGVLAKGESAEVEPELGMNVMFRNRD